MLISPVGDPGLAITPRNTVKTSAITATTAVISPRGQASAWPRMITQARITGAAAPARNTYRKTVSEFQPLHDVSGPWQLFRCANELPSEYQDRNTEIPRR